MVVNQLSGKDRVGSLREIDEWLDGDDVYVLVGDDLQIRKLTQGTPIRFTVDCSVNGDDFTFIAQTLSGKIRAIGSHEDVVNAFAIEFAKIRNPTNAMIRRARRNGVNVSVAQYKSAYAQLKIDTGVYTNHIASLERQLLDASDRRDSISAKMIELMRMFNDAHPGETIESTE